LYATAFEPLLLLLLVLPHPYDKAAGPAKPVMARSFKKTLLLMVSSFSGIDHLRYNFGMIIKNIRFSKKKENALTRK
jgi:hypothetical protein